MPSMHHVALCAAIPVQSVGAAAPEWVHLLPAGEVRTIDGRGPYRVPNLAMLAAASLPAGGKLPLDENHATDLAAPQGLPAPARGWIVQLQARRDGMWGRVEWTAEGRQLARAYRGISPVIAHDKSGSVTAILRASLTNTPNLAGLRTLHSAGSTDVAAESALDPQTVARKARARQALCAQAGLPIDFASAVRSVMDEDMADEATTDAPAAAMDPQLLAQRARELEARMQRLGVPITFADAVRAVHDGRAG